MKSSLLLVIASCTVLLSDHGALASSDDSSSTAVADEPSPSAVAKRKTQLRRQLQSINDILEPAIASDQTLNCIGDTTTTFQTTTDSYTVAHTLVATVGIPYKCSMKCDNTGATSLTIAVSDATTSGDITSSDKNTYDTTDGCKPDSTGIEVVFTATKCAHLYAIAFCSGGCSGASITCSDNCATTAPLAIASWFKNTATTMIQRFGSRAGGFRRRLKHNKFIRTPQGEKD